MTAEQTPPEAAAIEMHISFVAASGPEGWMRGMANVLADVAQERAAQNEQYGDQTFLLEDGTGPETRWLLPYTTDSAAQIQEAVRHDYEEFEEEVGLPTRAHLLREELAESFETSPDDPHLEKELLQVAALAVQWVESLRARRASGIHHADLDFGG